MTGTRYAKSIIPIPVINVIILATFNTSLSVAFLLMTFSYTSLENIVATPLRLPDIVDNWEDSKPTTTKPRTRLGMSAVTSTGKAESAFARSGNITLAANPGNIQRRAKGVVIIPASTIPFATLL